VTALDWTHLFADLLGKGFRYHAKNHVAHFRASGIFWMTGIAFAILPQYVFLRRKNPATARNSAEAV